MVTNTNFSVKVDAFDGPLDLLLHLIEKHEVNIFDIPIVSITEQYLRYIENFADLDMDSLSGFLLMAATLLSIKAKMLLPKNKEAEEGEEADPRAELARKLQLYKEFKEKALEFAEREKTGVLAYYREPDGDFRSSSTSHLASGTYAFFPDGSIEGIVSPERLSEIFRELLLRQERRVDKVRAGFGEIPPERYSIAEKMTWLEDKLRHRPGKVSFFALFDGDSSKEEMLVTFLALLELMRQRRCAVRQDRLFDDIMITRPGGRNVT